MAKSLLNAQKIAEDYFASRLFPTKEEWRPIGGYEDYYISTYGRVRSTKNNGDKILKVEYNRHRSGYGSIMLTNNGKQYRLSVHRLVAKAFIPNPNNLPQINHKNEIPYDNYVGNLEWCNGKYNSNYGNHNNRLASSRRIPVAMFDYEGNLILTHESSGAAARFWQLDRSAIAKCCVGDNLTYNGYIWLYYQDKNIKEILAERLRKVHSTTGGSAKYVSQYSLDGRLIKVYRSASEAARAFGVWGTSIRSAIINNGVCSGFKWKYTYPTLSLNTGVV